MELARTSRQQITPYSIWSCHEWPEEHVLQGFHPRRSVIPRGFATRHLTLKYRTGRVRLGKPPRGLTGCRRWRWRGLAVVGACHPFPAPSLRCPGPRIRRSGCSRGTWIESTDLFEQFRYSMCLTIHLSQFWKKNMPDAFESGRMKPQGSSTCIALHQGCPLTVMVTKATTSLSHSLCSKRIYPSSLFARYSTTGPMSIALPY